MDGYAIVRGRALFKFTALEGWDSGVGGGWSLPVGRGLGEWMPSDCGQLGRFGVGYRLAALPLCLGREFYVAEGAGESRRSSSMLVCCRARLVRRLEGWNNSTAEKVARSAASRVSSFFSRHRATLGELPMAAQDICERDSTWGWLYPVKDNLQIYAGLIANSASGWLVGEVADVAKAEKFEPE